MFRLWSWCAVLVLGARAFQRPIPPTPFGAIVRAGDDIDAVLRGLQGRVKELQDRRVDLPIVVLDSLLPGQRIVFASGDPAFREMIELCAVRAAEVAGVVNFEDDSERDLGAFGMVGADRATGRAYPFGVEANIVSTADLGDNVKRVEVTGGRRFSVDAVGDERGEGKPPAGAVVPRACTLAPPYDPAAEAAASAAAAEIPPLLARWEALVRDGGHERVPDHLALVRRDLGARPPPSDASALALWAGAYINPLPALGVSLEVRPALLAAPDAAERVAVAVAGLRSSCDHLAGTKPLW